MLVRNDCRLKTANLLPSTNENMKKKPMTCKCFTSICSIKALVQWVQGSMECSGIPTTWGGKKRVMWRIVEGVYISHPSTADQTPTSTIYMLCLIRLLLMLVIFVTILYCCYMGIRYNVWPHSSDFRTTSS